MPKTADLAPITITYTAPGPEHELLIARALIRKWKAPTRPSLRKSRSGRPEVYDLSGWEPGRVAVVPADRSLNIGATARRRGYVVTQLAPGVLYRIA
jgi:hypothetical protein